MSGLKAVPLPPHIISDIPEIAAPYDSCFIPRGFLFPESREELKPYREFPLSEPFYTTPKQNDNSVNDIFAEQESEDTGCFDSTILQISELDELLLDVQAMGMQYSMHMQMCVRTDLRYKFPHTWDQKQAMMCSIPVFSEELCQWHYPISTLGYNIQDVDPPLDIDTAHNYPQLFGYLPNGDIVVYWEIAEILSSEFGIALDPLRTTVDSTLILMPNVPDEIKRMAPCDGVTETGIFVGPKRDFQPAFSYAWQWLGRQPIVIKYAIYPFYRLRLPVIHCELDFNRYAEATWGAFGYTSQRLCGYEFKIVNNPFTRDAPIFATERGNIIVSHKFHERLIQLLAGFGMGCCTQLFPIQRLQ